jgi:hypothetical protein
MATRESEAVNSVPQALPAVILDDQGAPLIAEADLPFIDPSKGDGWQRIVWNPPTGYHAGMRYGLKCALYLLRCAPNGSRRRADEVSYYGDRLRDLQAQLVKGRRSNNCGAHWAAWKFWDVILEFTMQPATAANVLRYYNAHMIRLLEEEVAVLRARLSDARKKRQPKARHRRRKAVRS